MIRTPTAALTALLALLGGMLMAAPVATQLTALDPPVETTKTSSSPGFYPVVFEGKAWFSAYHSRMGGELWSSDGTSAGTSLVVDVDRSGSLSSFGVTSDFIWLGYNRSDIGTELFRFNRSTGATALVKDIRSGTDSSDPRNFMAAGSRMVFSAYSASSSQIIVSNGTSGGTVAISGLTYVGGAYSSGDLAFFIGYTAANGGEPWVSDGTSAGTRLLVDSVAGTSGGFGSSTSLSYFPRFVKLGDRTYFSNTTSTWYYDHSTGTTSLAGSGAHATDVQDTVFGDKILHGSTNDIHAFNGATGTKGVFLDLNFSTTPPSVKVCGDKIFFAGTSVAAGQELWVSDGTLAGSQMVKDIRPGSSGSSITILSASPAGYLLFQANDGTGTGYYVSDGTEAGTIRLTGTPATPEYLNYFPYLATSNGWVYRSDNATWGIEPFYIGFDGSHGLLKDIAAPLPNGLESIPVLGSKAFIAGHTPSLGTEVWVTEGTPATTSLLTDVNPGSGDALAEELVVLNNKLWFSATDGTSGEEPWISNGTTAGTSMLKEIFVGTNAGNPDGSSFPTDFVRLNSTKVVFAAADIDNARELWISDGTEAGTSLVLDISPGPSSASSPQNLTAWNGKVLTSAFATGYGREPWISDGTAAGTFILKDIGTGSTQSSPGPYFGWGSSLYFAAGVNSYNNLELWKSDGTTAGTALLKEIYPGSNSGFMIYPWFTVVGSNLYFAAMDGTNGVELWKTNGTAAGTVLVKDIRSGTASSTPQSLISYGGKLYLVAANIGELWVSDGTSAGTTKFLPNATWPDAVVNTISGMWVVDGLLYFPAWRPSTGFELWRSNGTTAGTGPFLDLIPGSEGSYPGSVAKAGQNLIVVADGPGSPHRAGGRQLYSIPMTIASDVTAPTIAVSGFSFQTGAEIDLSATITEAGSGLDTARLYVKVPGGSWAATGTPVSTLTPTFTYTPADGPGTYLFDIVATDLAGNATTTPSGAATGRLSVAWQPVEGVPVTVPVAAGAGVLVPVALGDNLGVTFTFANVATAGSLTVERQTGDVAPTGYDALNFIDQWFRVTNGGVGFDSATVQFGYTSGADMGGLTTGQILRAVRDDGGVLTELPASASATTITVTTTTFSDWYFGNPNTGLTDWPAMK